MSARSATLNTGCPDAPVSVVFMHGWGYDASIWRDVLPLLGNVSTICLDAGYFPTRHIGSDVNLLLPTTPFIAVGHSAGGPFLALQDPSQCRALILINSFGRLVRSQDFTTGQPVLLMQRMLRRFSDEPVRVLKQFYASLNDDRDVPKHINVARLKAGLTNLAQYDARQEMAHFRDRIHSLSASDDPLISRDMTLQSFPGIKRLEWTQGGHLLPLTQPEKCAQLILRCIKAEGQ